MNGPPYADVAITERFCDFKTTNSLPFYRCRIELDRDYHEEADENRANHSWFYNVGGTRGIKASL